MRSGERPIKKLYGWNLILSGQLAVSCGLGLDLVAVGLPECFPGIELTTLAVAVPYKVARADV
jgi:hypothetical protein